MFDQNPFAALNNALPPSAMQVYVVLMVLAVIVGTLLDMAHKGSATYFFAKSRKTRGQGRPEPDVGPVEVRRAGPSTRGRSRSRPRWSTCSRRASSATRGAASRTC